jgi:hypothetical protein
LVAAMHAIRPVPRGWWLVAFLSLVGGVAQLLLGPGLVALRRRRGAAPQAGRTAAAELVLWNVGTATVAIADLVPLMGGVLAGSALLLGALVLFAAGLRGAPADGLRRAPGWVGAYVGLLGFMAASVAVGVLLAYARGR